MNEIDKVYCICLSGTPINMNYIELKYIIQIFDKTFNKEDK